MAFVPHCQIAASVSTRFSFSQLIVGGEPCSAMLYGGRVSPRAGLHQARQACQKHKPKRRRQPKRGPFPPACVRTGQDAADASFTFKFMFTFTESDFFEKQSPAGLLDPRQALTLTRNLALTLSLAPGRPVGLGSPNQTRRDPRQVSSDCSPSGRLIPQRQALTLTRNLTLTLESPPGRRVPQADGLRWLRSTGRGAGTAGHRPALRPYPSR